MSPSTRRVLAAVETLPISSQSLSLQVLQVWRLIMYNSSEVLSARSQSIRPVSIILEERAAALGELLHIVDIAPGLASTTITPPMLFQKQNASLAIAITTPALEMKGLSPFLKTGELTEQVTHALETTQVAGRCDTRTFENINWRLDVAHTIESLQIAASWFLDMISSQKNSSQPMATLVFNHQSQKRDSEILLTTLYHKLCKEGGKRFARVIFCTNVTYKDGGSKLDLVTQGDSVDVHNLTVQARFAEIWKGLESDQETEVDVIFSLEEVVESVKKWSTGKERVEVLVTGGVYVVGGIIEILENYGRHAVNE